jgi:genome maintenance exonuclease 1
MLKTNPYAYPVVERVTNEDGTRYYTCPVTGEYVPSVTTILAATGDNTGLLEWRQFVGNKKADAIVEEACALGTLMHTNLENHVDGVERPRGNHKLRVLARNMADVIIANGLGDVTEVWGQEVAMFMPGMFAGTTDLVGCYKGRPAIMDYKTARKMKSADMIENYFCQIGAYCLCHDEVYGTAIDTGAIFMVDRALNYKVFEMGPADIETYKSRFLERFEAYLTAAQ